MFARARRLDGGVQREEVGLLGDAVDRDDEIVDACRALMQLADVGGHVRESRLCGSGLLCDCLDARLRERHRFFAASRLICGLRRCLREIYDVLGHGVYGVEQFFDIRFYDAVFAGEFVDALRCLDGVVNGLIDLER